MNEIKAGSIVSLTFDFNKRFLVENDTLIGGKIRVLYFNEILGKITTADIEPEYLVKVDS